MAFELDLVRVFLVPVDILAGILSPWRGMLFWCWDVKRFIAGCPLFLVWLELVFLVACTRLKHNEQNQPVCGGGICKVIGGVERSGTMPLVHAFIAFILNFD